MSSQYYSTLISYAIYQWLLAVRRVLVFCCHSIIDNLLFPVSDISAIAVLLFDMTVVAVTIYHTVRAWRLFKQSTWHQKSITDLLLQQSKQCSPLPISHVQKECSIGLMRYGYFSILVANEHGSDECQVYFDNQSH